MKILFYNDFSSQLGGTEIHQRTIGDGLRSLGYEIRYFYADERRALKNDFLFRSTMVANSLFNNINIASRLTEEIDSFNPDIIHINNNKLYTSTVLNVVRKSRAKVVSAFHDFHFSLEPETEFKQSNLKHQWKRLLLKRIEKESDVLLSYTHIVRSCLLKAGVREVARLPLFVDESKWLYKENCHLNPPVILFFGRIEVQKGVLLLFEAFKKVKESVPEAQLHYVGTGMSFRELTEMVEKYPEKQSVMLYGRKEQSELLKLLHRSRVSVVPSVWPEPFGLTGLESQSAGVPVVGADIGGIPEWCVEGVSGLLFPRGNAEALRDKILQLLQDPGFSERLSRSARQFCSENFSFAEVLRATASFYQNLIK